MACNRENRNTTAVGIVQSVNQMQIPMATAPGTHRQAPGQMRFRASSKCGRLFVPDVNPFDSFVGTDCVRDRVGENPPQGRKSSSLLPPPEYRRGAPRDSS